MNENNYDPDIDFYFPPKRRQQFKGVKLSRLFATMASRLRLPQAGSKTAPQQPRVDNP